MIIKLPNLSFIYQPQGGWMITNTYSGSLGTDPEKGCRNREIFCFKISIIGDAEDPSIKAECYTQFASMDGLKKIRSSRNDCRTYSRWIENSKRMA